MIYEFFIIIAKNAPILDGKGRGAKKMLYRGKSLAC